jgi:glycosyltransferase involved in cell wall biosynthesis
VRLLGHLEQPDEELKTADALLVPSRIPLGIRVRIVTAFSYGCPVVTHESSRLGIPELDHGRNALVGRSGRDLAEAFLRLVSDAELKERLERGGRETYERWFAPRVAAGRIAAMLERIVRRPAAVPAR